MKYFLFFSLFTFLSFSQTKNTLPDGFVYVKDVIPSIQLELRYFTAYNFAAMPVEGYHAAKGILSDAATQALKKVQDELKEYDLSIKIFDAYRPQRAVNHFKRWAMDLNDTLNKKVFYPDVKKKDLFKEGYIAALSGHSRGSTLDMTLVGIISGQELDMGSTYDLFGKRSWVLYKAINPQQRANRMLLQTIMLKHGFIHYPKEWWHFTLKAEPFPETYFDFVVE